MKFDVITSWEVMEHIKQEDVPQVLDNIKKHLKDSGLFIGSIDVREDVINGVTLHQTVKPQEWWMAVFKDAGFSAAPNIHKFFGSHYLFKSGPGFNITCSINPSLAPAIPKERLRKRCFEIWAGSKPQKILKRIVNGGPN